VRTRKNGEAGTAKRMYAKSDGTGYIGKDGYRILYIDGVRVKEHRFVMEQIIGRKLLRFESVHHINGIKHDNRPANLELWTSHQPSGQRVIDQIKWAKEILELYKDVEDEILEKSELVKNQIANN
jgi:hypothetical protein